MSEHLLLNPLRSKKKFFINIPISSVYAKHIEAIDVVETWQLDYHLANLINCISRAGVGKESLKDLINAEWYINRKIMSLSDTFQQGYCSEEADHLSPHKIAENWHLSPNLSLLLSHVLIAKEEDYPIERLFKILSLLRSEIRSLLKKGAKA